MPFILWMLRKRSLKRIFPLRCVYKTDRCDVEWVNTLRVRMHGSYACVDKEFMDGPEHGHIPISKVSSSMNVFVRQDLDRG